MFEVDASVIIVLSLVLVALALPPRSSVPSERGVRRTCLGARGITSLAGVFSPSGGCGRKAGAALGLEKRGFGGWQRGGQKLSSLLLSLGQHEDIEAMALVTTGGLFLTISETKSSSVGYKMRVSLPGEAVVKSGRV